MADFAVTHLARWQTDCLTRPFYQGVRIFREPLVKMWSPGQLDGVAFGCGRETEPVQYYQR